jgi:hypothetical protein
LSKPKKHHYISQFYLTGFNSDNTKEGQIFCFDLVKIERRRTKVKEVGFEKYFNRIEAEGLEEDFLEKEISKFESKATELFRKIIHEKCLPTSEKDKNILFEFISALAVRNPALRKSFDEYKKNLLLTMVQFYLSDENTWNNYRKKAENDGVKGISNLTYSQAKKLFIDTKWNMISHNNDFVNIEIPSIEKVAHLLNHRKWTLFDASLCSYTFITSDRPVKLFWNDSELSRSVVGPGFGMKSSGLYFPLSKYLFLMGSYEKSYPNIIATDEMVANLNSLQFYYTTRYLFSSNETFFFNGPEDLVISSDTMLNIL